MSSTRSSHSHFSRHGHLSHESVSRCNPLYNANEVPSELPSHGGESYHRSRQDSHSSSSGSSRSSHSSRSSPSSRSSHSSRSSPSSRSSHSSRSSQSSGSSLDSLYHPRRSLFDCFFRRKPVHHDDHHSSMSSLSSSDIELQDSRQEKQDKVFSVSGGPRCGKHDHHHKHGKIPRPREPDPEPDPDLEKKRRWLICKTLLLVVLLVLCLVLFVVVLVAIKDENFDDVSEPTTEEPVPLFEAVTVNVSLVIARPYSDIDPAFAYANFYVEYIQAMQEIFYGTYLGEHLLYTEIIDIRADETRDGCTLIHSKLVFDFDILGLDIDAIIENGEDAAVALEMTRQAIARDVEAVLWADAARWNGEIRKLDGKPETITVADIAIIELLPVLPTSEPTTRVTTTTKKPTTTRTTTRRTTTTKRPTTTKTTTRRQPPTTRTTTTRRTTTTKRPTTTTKTTTKAPTTTEKPTTTVVPTTTVTTTEKPPTTTEGICPPGVPLYNCFINPCDVAFCYHYPDAYCVPDYCGGCNANFYHRFTGAPVSCWNDCPYGQTPVQCSFNPCDEAECPLDPNAFCQADNCGGCNADFFDLPVGGNRVVCQDDIAPTITCPDNVLKPIYYWQAGTRVYFPPAVVEDNYAVDAVYYTQESGDFFFEGETYVTVTVVDSSGNYGSCVFLVYVYVSDDIPPPRTAPPGTRPPVPTLPSDITEPPPPVLTTTGVPVQDIQPPYLLCPDDIIHPNDPGKDQAEVTWPPIYAYDDIDTSVSVTTDIPWGSNLTIGETTVTVTATDDAGNFRRCAFLVTVIDVEKPLVLCPTLDPVETDQDMPTARVTLPTLGPAKEDIRATDNSRMQPTIIPYDVVQYFPIGETLYMIYAVDNDGNVGFCNITITVYDHQMPTIKCPAHQTLFTFDGVITYEVPIADPWDNSGIWTLSREIGFRPHELEEMFDFAPGWHIITYTVTDPSGNTAECGFSVEVIVIQAVYEGSIQLEKFYSSNLASVTSAEHDTIKDNFEMRIAMILNNDVVIQPVFEGVNVDRFTSEAAMAVVNFRIGFSAIPNDDIVQLESDTKLLIRNKYNDADPDPPVPTADTDTLEGDIRQN